VEELLDAVEQASDGEDDAAGGDECGFEAGGQGGCGEEPAAGGEGEFAEEEGPGETVVGGGDDAGDVHQDDESKHHEGKEEAGPADHDFGGDAEGCGDECDADEVGPEEAEGHVVGDDGEDDVDAPDVECTEDGHGDGEGEVGEGGDFVDGAGVDERGAGGPEGDEGDEAGEDACEAHGEGDGREKLDEESFELGGRHLDPREERD